MKQVNFSDLNVEFEIDKFQKINLSHEVGNAIHRNAETVPMADLARKIYHSDGPLEILDEDYNSMMNILSRSFKVLVCRAIEIGTTDVEPKKDEEYESDK